MTAPDEPPMLPRRSRLGIGAAIVVVLLALAVTVGIGILRGATAPVETVRTDTGRTDTTGADAAAAPVVYVHVSGAVRAPGLYVLDGAARVVDAVAAAGGFAADADRSAVNLARALGDGEQLDIPAQGEAPSAEQNAIADTTVNLNTASATELDTLPRIGPALAERIIQWREQNGPFTSVDDLLAVPGIGDKMLEAMRDLVSI